MQVANGCSFDGLSNMYVTYYLHNAGNGHHRGDSDIMRKFYGVSMTAMGDGGREGLL